MAAEVTRDQAAAFFEALLGYVDLSESNGRPASEHALTHLRAVLGLNGLPGPNGVMQFINKGQARDPDETVRCLCLRNYLEGICKAMYQAEKS